MSSSVRVCYFELRASVGHYIEGRLHFCWHQLYAVCNWKRKVRCIFRPPSISAPHVIRLIKTTSGADKCIRGVDGLKYLIFRTTFVGPHEIFRSILSDPHCPCFGKCISVRWHKVTARLAGTSHRKGFPQWLCTIPDSRFYISFVLFLEGGERKI